MTVELSVKEVRTSLLRAAGSDAMGVGEPASLLLGSIFHSVFADLVSPDPFKSGLRIITEGGENSERRLEQLLEHTWSRLLAPRLVRHAANLQAISTRVLTCWHATQNLCRWLDAVALELLQLYPECQGSWERIAELLQAEVPVECILCQEDWTEPVRLVGTADSILCVPGRETYCTIELKLGRAAPVVDLGQVVLYHLMLARSANRANWSALSVVRFSPEVDEYLVHANELAEAEQRLIHLIGQIAGVVREKTVIKPNANENGQGKYNELGKRLVRAYREQGVGIELKAPVSVGPRFLRFDVRLTPGMRLDGLRRRTQEIMHRLELGKEPLVVQEAGHLYIDLERPDPQTIRFSDVRRQLPAMDSLRGSSKLPIGVDAAGNLHLADMGSAGRSHVLVAGTTGSGKSEWLRMALAGLIASNTPDTLRVATLDPKLAAFSDLEHSEFLWRDNAWWIPGSGRGAGELFGDLVEEMEERYQLTREAGSDNLREYVEKTGKPLARIVCVCDEYFALISQSKEEKKTIEAAVALLGAKGRAAGIHLVLATQQPSRATISGAIQANLPCRVALWLQSPIESNMILSSGGAERLTGSGDLLYKDFGSPIRLQAPYLPPEERMRWLAGEC